MCDPLTIAGIALTAGSTVMNQIAAGQVADARDEAVAAEMMRQRSLDKEAGALATENQDEFAGFEPARDEKQESLADFFTAQTATPAPEALPASSSNITVQEEKKQLGQARDFTEGQANALANLRSFGDVLGDLNRSLGRNASEIGMLGGFKQASQGILPHELEAANQEGAGLRTLADIMGGVGGLGLSAGLSGGSLSSLFGGGGAAFPPAPQVLPTSGFIPTPTPRPIYGGLY